MTNYDHIIKELHTHIEAINTSDDLYHFLANSDVFEHLCWKCKNCEKLFGTCPDTLKNDHLCRERFRLWCSQEPHSLI